MKKILIAAVMLIFATASAAAGETLSRVSKPFDYSGYSQKEYSDYTKTSYYVPMSDGVKIAVDVYLPAKGPARGKFPAVMELTPYSRSFINAAFKVQDRTRGKNMLGGKGAEIPNPFCFSQMLVEHGYAVVIADVRGSGASFGSRLDMMPRLGLDGAQLVDWIAAQPWSDGSVGMKGASYMAITQILTAANRPSALKAIFLMVYPFGYQDIYAGGIYSQGFMSALSVKTTA